MCFKKIIVIIIAMFFTLAFSEYNPVVSTGAAGPPELGSVGAGPPTVSPVRTGSVFVGGVCCRS